MMRARFRSAKLLTVFAALGWFTVISRSQEFTPEMRAKVNQMVNVQRNWGEKLNSAGAALRLREIKKVMRDGTPAIDYQMYATGLPHDRTYEITNLLITMEARKLMSGVTLDKDGRALRAGRTPEQCGDANKPDDPIDLILSGLPGEPLRLSLISSDGAYKTFASVVPDPISTTDGGCQLNVVRLLPRFELALIQATGFPAETEIEFQSNSMGEIHNGKLKTDKAGYADAGIMPAVKDMAQGTIEVRLVAPKCKPKVKFHWGSTSE